MIQIPLLFTLSIFITGLVIPAPYFYTIETSIDNVTKMCAFSNEPNMIWVVNYFKIQFLLLLCLLSLKHNKNINYKT